MGAVNHVKDGVLLPRRPSTRAMKTGLGCRCRLLTHSVSLCSVVAPQYQADWPPHAAHLYPITKKCVEFRKVGVQNRGQLVVLVVLARSHAHHKGVSRGFGVRLIDDRGDYSHPPRVTTVISAECDLDIDIR